MVGKISRGASGNTSDYENSETSVLTMAPNTAADHDIHVRSPDHCGGILSGHRCNDYVDVKFTLKNEYK